MSTKKLGGILNGQAIFLKKHKVKTILLLLVFLLGATVVASTEQATQRASAAVCNPSGDALSVPISKEIENNMPTDEEFKFKLTMTVDGEVIREKEFTLKAGERTYFGHSSPTCLGYPGAKVKITIQEERTPGWELVSVGGDTSQKVYTLEYDDDSYDDSSMTSHITTLPVFLNRKVDTDQHNLNIKKVTDAPSDEQFNFNVKVSKLVKDTPSFYNTIIFSLDDGCDYGEGYKDLPLDFAYHYGGDKGFSVLIDGQDYDITEYEYFDKAELNDYFSNLWGNFRSGMYQKVESQDGADMTCKMGGSLVYYKFITENGKEQWGDFYSNAGRIGGLVRYKGQEREIVKEYTGFSDNEQRFFGVIDNGLTPSYPDLSSQFQSAGENGIYSFSLKNGEGKSIAMDEGYSYEVWEETKEGWKLVAINNNSSLTKAEGTMGTEDVTYTFKNESTKTPELPPKQDTTTNPQTLDRKVLPLLVMAGSATLLLSALIAKRSRQL